MTVAELQVFLSDLGKFLRAAESAKVAGELEYVSARLTPFKDYKVKAFADFLEKAEAESRLGPSKPSAVSKKKGKPDPAAVEQACQRVLELYGKAIDPSVTVEQIEVAVNALVDLDPPKARLEDQARQMGYTQKFRAKADIIKAIRQKIVGRKGAFERPNA